MHAELYLYSSWFCCYDHVVVCFCPLELLTIATYGIDGIHIANGLSSHKD